MGGAQTSTLQKILEKCVQHKGSDIHIGGECPPMVRIDGSLLCLADHTSLTNADVEEAVREVLTRNQQELFKENQEIDFAFNYSNNQGEKYRFRGNCFYEKGNVCMALRLVPSKIRLLGDLGLPRALAEVAKKHRGLFLVTGTTGSGKSTTLASLVHEINRTRACHIITIEDPIEYIHVSDRAVVRQREVGADTKGFVEALRRILRQDPDVIMIGEMRDLETIAIAVTAAETGHLVLATLHTHGASQAVDRVIDVFPSNQQQQIKQQLSSVLIGVCAQQLIPRIGFGRVVATELMFVNPAIRNLIRENKSGAINDVIQTNSLRGMHTMDQDLARLVRDCEINFETALSYAYNPKDVEAHLSLDPTEMGDYTMNADRALKRKH